MVHFVVQFFLVRKEPGGACANKMNRNPKHRGPHKVEQGGKFGWKNTPRKLTNDNGESPFLTGDTSSFMVVFLLSFMIVLGGVAIIHLKLQDGWPF